MSQSLNNDVLKLRLFYSLHIRESECEEVGKSKTSPLSGRRRVRANFIHFLALLLAITTNCLYSLPKTKQRNLLLAELIFVLIISRQLKNPLIPVES